MPRSERWAASSSPLRYFRAWAFHGRARRSSGHPGGVDEPAGHPVGRVSVHRVVDRRPRRGRDTGRAAWRDDPDRSRAPRGRPARASRSCGLAVVITTLPCHSSVLGTISPTVLPEPLGPKTTAETQSSPGQAAPGRCCCGRRRVGAVARRDRRVRRSAARRAPWPSARRAPEGASRARTTRRTRLERQRRPSRRRRPRHGNATSAGRRRAGGRRQAVAERIARARARRRTCRASLRARRGPVSRVAMPAADPGDEVGADRRATDARLPQSTQRR